jgi:polar amino acid transport system substrate-binding protein
MRLLALAACCAFLIAGCGGVSDRALTVSEPTLGSKPAQQKASKPDPIIQCADPTASLRPPAQLPPPGQMPAGSFMRKIQERGTLYAGVDQNTLGFGYTDPETAQPEGFEIDLLRQVAKALGVKVQFRALTSSQRIDAVRSGKVDIVASALTINCFRRELVEFSAPYYEAGQRLLVPAGSPITGLGDLRGRRVCATSGSTSLQSLINKHSGAIPVPVSQRTDCLVRLQQGTVDAITSDDAILLGFQAQDPYTKLVGPRFEREPYGMAVNRAHPEFVRFLNGVLARMRSDGRWAALDRRWLQRLDHGRPHRPPTPHYRD